MKICTKCRIESTAKKFCKKCRSPLVDGFFCNGKNEDGSVCGEILEPDDNFCGECGTDVKSLEQKEDVLKETRTEDESEGERSKNAGDVSNDDMEFTQNSQIVSDLGHEKSKKEDAKLVSETGHEKTKNEDAKLVSKTGNEKSKEQDAKIVSKTGPEKSNEEDANIVSETGRREKCRKEDAKIVSETGHEKSNKEDAKIVSDTGREKSNKEDANIVSETGREKSKIEDAKVVSKTGPEKSNKEDAKIVSKTGPEKSNKEDAKIVSETGREKSNKEDANIVSETGREISKKEDAKIVSKTGHEKSIKEDAKLVSETGHENDTKSDGEDFEMAKEENFEMANEENFEMANEYIESHELQQSDLKQPKLKDTGKAERITGATSFSTNAGTKPKKLSSIPGKVNAPSFITVNFRAIISQDIKYKEERLSVVLNIFENGVPQQERTIMETEFQKEKENNRIVTVVSLEKVLPRRTTVENKIAYEYQIYKQVESGSQWSLKCKIKGKLLIPSKYHQIDVWAQFDGIVYKDHKESPEYFYQKVIRKGAEVLFRGKLTEAEKSARIFGQLIVASILEHHKQTTFHQIRQTCAQIFIGLETCFKVGNDVDLKKKIYLCLWLAFEDGIQTRLPNENKQQTEGRFLLLVSMLYLCYDYKIEPTNDSKDLICERVTLKPHEQELIELNLLEKLPHAERAELCGVFLEFCLKVQNQSKNPRWLYLVPFIHFLNGQSHPYEKTPRDYSHDARQPAWWGIQEGAIDYIVNSFKEEKGKPWPVNCSLQSLSACLKPLFELDYLLPRTVIACLNFHELKDAIETHIYPVEIVCAALNYYVKTRGIENQEYLMKCLEGILHQITTRSEESGCEVRRWLKATISGQLLDELTKTSSQELVQRSAEIFTLCMSMYDHSLQKDNQDEKDENMKCVIKATGNVISMLIKGHMSTDRIVRVWNNLLIEEITPNDRIITAWNSNLKSAIQKSLKRRIDDGDSIVILTEFCKNVDRMKKDMKEMMYDIVQEAVPESGKLDTSGWTETEKQNLNSVMRNKFLRDWDTMATEYKGMGITALVNWPHLPFFLRILYKGESLHQPESSDCTKKLHDFKETTEKIISCLWNGNIAINELKLLSEQKKPFCEMVKYLECRDFERVAEVLEIRVSEFKQFSDQKIYLDFLKNLCSSLPSVDTGPIDEIFQREKECCALNRIVVVTAENPLEQFSNTDRVQIRSSDSSLINLLNWVEGYTNSQLFGILWNEECRKQQDVCETFNDIETHVMTSLRERLTCLSDRISSGEITFREIEQLFGDLYHESYDKMRNDLALICKDECCIDKRIEQLRRCRSYQKINEIAYVMMDLKDVYSMDGNFSPFQNSLCGEFEDKAFNDFEESLTIVSELLEEMNKEKTKCLKAFVTCHELVLWLRESMKDSGLSEFTVFVDLATISAGENAEKMAMVKSLHAAVNAYAPLIFELKSNSDYKDLIEKCKAVWRILDESPYIYDSLLFANQHLQWYKHVKDTRGEVEITSFMEANLINEFGIFTIGINAEKNQETRTDVGTNADLSDVIKLTIPKDEDQGRIEVREYSLSELEELQSKLMLVAGEAEKGKENVERFTMVLDGVIRLSKVYIRLVTCGCVLFTNFAIKLFCEPNLDTPVCVILEFKNGEDLRQLKCQKTKEERLENIMPKVASQMEKCLEDWIEFVNHNRTEHPHLNYFTMDQLVILQKEIAKISLGKEPSPTLFPLLYFAKSNCNKDDVVNANKEAIEEIKKEQTGTHNQQENVPAENENPKRDEFISKLVKAKYERLVPFAVEQFPDFNISKALFWCMKNKNNIEKFESERRARLKQTTDITDDLATGDSQPADTIDALMRRTMASEGQYDSCEFMLAKFAGVWKDFIHAIISSLQDFISLKQLGVLLHHLAKKEESHHNRTLPDPYVESSPNLVICHTDEVLITTLSVYMVDKSSEDLPLPQSDEVLMCSANTSLEKVDVFLRRAIFFSNGKIHCIVNADLMDFHVCEGLYDRLQEYIRRVDDKDKYRLVIICGSEKEHSLSLISSLEKYRKNPLVLDIGRVKTNIERKLKLQMEKEKAAAQVDFNKSTVRLVLSRRSGVGKTLYKKRREEDLKRLTGSEEFKGVTLPLHQKRIDLDYVIGRLLQHTEGPGFSDPRLFHIDVTNEVQEGVDFLLFNLLILGCLVHRSGYIWRKSCYDLYLVETMVRTTHKIENKDTLSKHQMLNLLPTVTCRSPEESLTVYKKEALEGYDSSDQLFDEELYKSDLYQKPYDCLLQLDKKKATDKSQQNCLETLLKTCLVKDPSWSELYHFVSFLHTQIVDFENNFFVSTAAKSDLPGFDTFVQKFLIQMSKDFSSRSLNMSEETDSEVDASESGKSDELSEFQIKRTWESSPHPYLFFNADHFTFTFLGFYIDRGSGNLIDIQTQTVLEKNIMTTDLYDRLVRNGVPIQEDFEKLSRTDKIERLCTVMGITPPSQGGKDPDVTYELTTDNVKKMMAIYMRFRCNIPVVIMGETGCGKTRLVKFLCDLMASNSRKESGKTAQNMIIVKVHGGTTNQDIISKVKQAEKVAEENLDAFGENLFTVLFFDEANTTESIGLMKEIMCDKTMDGLPLTLCKNLKLVAACNPYRRHPKNLIDKLEKAGLGYHVRASETTDRLGRIPLRRLVYRVHPLPQSMLPFVWDFGQLSTEIEGLYIQQMVKRYMEGGRIPNDGSLLTVISEILTNSQEYMRTLKDECSFVSLRDVDRVLQIMCWFYSRLDTSFFKKADEKLKDIYTQEGVTSAQFESLQLSKEARSLVLALGVCYHACLSERHKYREFISKVFREPCALTRGPDQIQVEIDCCQEAFLDAISLEEDIARNNALKENVFMMVICVELRIPLFLVGKPGSSKSLARLKVVNAMKGLQAKNEIFKEMKQAHMMSFQCSPLSTSAGITTIFRQCAAFQKNNVLDKFVSVVVLDEVGLAEDSSKMPLKTLHPLLEDGCQGDETPEPYKKVGFIGISNWALDPAKMNRGIFVQRGVPDSTELEDTAKGICQKTLVFAGMDKLIHELSTAYLKVFLKATETKREFFGLRDFYCLMKMINKFVEDSRRPPTFYQLRFALLRNFSGLDTMDAVDIFFNEIETIKWKNKPDLEDPDDSFKGLIDCCLLDTTSRHLLLITENYSALSTFQEHFLARKPKLKANTIFGSSFRRDQEYTQVCRNINRIKVCMEAGSTVVLLNSENLYESLYETLNQYYEPFGGQKYVDLGLGTHRVKCPVHNSFKLIVVAEKQTVYDEFPIPLINRLEKHNLTSDTMLTVEQLKTANELSLWAKTMTKYGLQLSEDPIESDVGKVIIGFHDDACSAIILHIWEQQHCRDEIEHRKLVIEKAKEYLLWCATPDAIVRICNNSPDDKDVIEEIYWKKQAHESISEYLRLQLTTIEEGKRLLAQVTTRTKLLTSVHQAALSESCGLPESQVLILESLTTFDTEQQFSSKIRDFLRKAKDAPVLIVIQCDTGDEHSNLIACARHSAMDECSKANRTRKSPVHIVVVIQLTTLSHRDFKSIQCGEWHSVHIDHLHSVSNAMPDFLEMQGKSIASLVNEATTGIESENYNEKSSDTNPSADFQMEKRCVDLKQILSMCVQRAMSMVRDTGEGGFRITNTISLVLNLLHTDDFAKGIGILLARLLEDKDKSSVPYRVENWLSLEAATEDMIQKTGTLRRSCLQTFERKLSPGLAGIIAVLDTNKNIDILSDKDCWKYDLWVRMLNRTDIFSLTYREVVQLGKDNQPVDFVVHGTGFEGQCFKSKMPFSWLIFNKLSEIIKCDTGYLSEMDGKRSNLAFEETPIMKELKTVPEDCYEEAIDCYIVDFVHMVYASNDENEMTIVGEMVKQETNVVDSDNTELSTALINVHIAFKNLSLKLKYFREINHVWEECSRKLLCLSGLPEEHVLRENKCTDRVLQALYLLIDELSPTDEHSESVFNDPSSRSSWLVKVHRCRYVVQQTFSAYAYIKDTENENTLTEARTNWNRVVVMQLFLENVCKSSSDENITIELCDPLWMQLSEDKVDMKKIATLEKVQEFLGTCFELAKDEYETKQHRCSHCSKVLSDTSRKLPCKHDVCAICIQTMQQENMSCPSCQTKVEIGFFDKTESRYISGKDKLEDYRRRCTVFLMDIVSQLCFSENQAPDTDVIERLMSYSLESEITRAGVDQSHAFKTFIFKLLIRTSEKEFRHQLEKYLAPSETDTTDTSDSEDSTEEGSQEKLFQKEELLLIIAYCIEDNINEKIFYNQYHVSLDEAKALLCKSDSAVDQLEGIALSRICLANAAQAIHRQVSIRSEEDDNTMLNEEDNIFLTEIKEFCDITEETGPWKYLVKFLYRCYGIDIVTAAFESNNLLISWIYKNELKSQEPDRIDRYITCGEKYCQFKEYFAGSIGTQGTEHLVEFVKNQGLPHEQGFVYLHMAMYWEIAISKCQRNTDKVKLMLTCMKDSNVYCGNRAIVLALANNDLPSFHVGIESKAKEIDINIKSLAFQWTSILLNVEEQSTCGLLKTLIDLAKNPHQFADAFLPTMEQDDMHELIALLREEATDTQNVYRCKNGHPYVIQDCGRPWYKGKCPCGANIGGQLHKLEESNIEDDGSDKTRTGHILGRPENRQNGPNSERDLKRINCACIRLLLHLTMYVGCSRQQYQDVHELIKADIEQPQTVIFLLGHIEKDIEDIRGVLNLNIDDVLIFCHNLLDSFIENSASSPEDISYSWKKKENRQQWENKVDKKYICPVVQDCVGILKSGSDLLKKNNDLVTMLSESGEEALQDNSSELLCKNPMFWNYRVPVSFSHMKNTFQRKYLSDTKSVPFPLLKHFLEKEHALKGIRFIPSILKLQRILLRKFSQRFYKEDMKGMTVRTLKQEKVADEETEGLIKDVVDAWDIARLLIVERKHFCLSEFGKAFVPKELCDIPITDDTEIEVLLPNMDDRGICSFAMLEILMQIQNEFLDVYLKISESNGAEVSLSTVCPKEITSAHLISFDTHLDIQPLIFANCSFHVRDSNIVYEFENFERQLVDRFVSTKSKLITTPFLEIDTMVYRTDISVSDAMQMLESKIQQEPLTTVMRNQICGDFKDFPDICQILSNLDIAIRVLNVTGGEEETLLYEFMVEKLKMNRGVLTFKIQRLCNLSHVKSLWMTLSIQKAVIMITHGKNTKEVFEAIGDPYHEPVPEKNQDQFTAFLQRQSSERLHMMLDIMYEYIVLRVSVKENEEDEDFIDMSGYPLKHCIYQYASGIDREEEIEFVTFDMHEGYDFPDEIQLKHCLSAWALVVRQITQSKAV